MDNVKTVKAGMTPDQFVSRKLFQSILIIIFSLFCMTYSAWAMFADSARETTHTLSAANFHISVAYPDSDGATINPGNISVLTPGEYKITLTASGSSSERSGYAKIILGSDSEDSKNIWYTSQMLPSDSGSDLPSKVVFTLIIPDEAGSVTLSIASTWATLAHTSDSEYNILSDNQEITYKSQDISDNTDTPEKAEKADPKKTEETGSDKAEETETEEIRETEPEETQETEPEEIQEADSEISEEATQAVNSGSDS